MSGYVFVTGYCICCARLFTFSATKVPSVRVDGAKEPVCRSCVELVNLLRIANNLEPIQILPGAYDPEPEENLS